VRLNFKQRLVAIFLQYDKEKYRDAYQRFRSYLSKLDQNRVTYILIDNKDEGNGSWFLDDGTIYLQGDNTDREFSGWQRGVDYLRNHDIACNVVLFANEAFEAIEVCYLKNHRPGWLINKAHTLKMVFGLVATRWEKTLVHGKSTRVWLGTHCFFVPREVVERLVTVISVDERTFEDYLPKDFPGKGEVFKQTAPINQASRIRIIRWLTEEWHSKMAITDSTWPYFRAKAKAILNEELLSIRIRELGYWILPHDIPLFVFLKVRGGFRKARKAISRKSESTTQSGLLADG